MLTNVASFLYRNLISLKKGKFRFALDGFGGVLDNYNIQGLQYAFGRDIGKCSVDVFFWNLEELA